MLVIATAVLCLSTLTLCLLAYAAHRVQEIEYREKRSRAAFAVELAASGLESKLQICEHCRGDSVILTGQNADQVIALTCPRCEGSGAVRVIRKKAKKKPLCPCDLCVRDL